jgi:hypothetical protein
MGFEKQPQILRFAQDDIVFDRRFFMNVSKLRRKSQFPRLFYSARESRRQ